MYFLRQNRFKLTLLFLLTFSYPTQTVYSWFYCRVAPQHLQLHGALGLLDKPKENSAIIINLDNAALYASRYYYHVNGEVLKFYQEVIRKGYTVIFLTEQSSKYLEEIYSTLFLLGYNQESTYLICMSAEPDQLMQDCFNTRIIMPDKWRASVRKKISEEKSYLTEGIIYTIVMTLDSDEKNLRDGYTGATVLVSKPTVETGVTPSSKSFSMVVVPL